MEIENRLTLNKDMAMLTGSEILEGLRKPKLHRRLNRPKSAHFKMIASRPKSAHPSGRNSRAKQDAAQIKTENEETILNNVNDDQNIPKMSLERPQTARPPTRMSNRYEEVFLEDEDDLNVDPVEYFNRPVSRMEGYIQEPEVDDVRENMRVINNGNYLRDDEEYYMNMDPVEYFADPNIRDIIAVVELEDKKPIKQSAKESDTKRKLSDMDANVPTQISKNNTRAHMLFENGARDIDIKNTKADDKGSENRKSEIKTFNYQLKEQNYLGIKQDKLLKNRTSIRATNQFTSSYGNIQNNSQYKTKYNGYAGVLKTRPTSLIEQTTDNDIKYAAGVHVGNKGRDRLKSDSIMIQNANKTRPYSEDRKLILPEKKIYEFNSTPAERVLAKYTKGLSIDERKMTRLKSNKESSDLIKKTTSKHGLTTNSRTMPPPRKLKPLLFNFEHVKF